MRANPGQAPNLTTAQAISDRGEPTCECAGNLEKL